MLGGSPLPSFRRFWRRLTTRHRYPDKTTRKKAPENPAFLQRAAADLVFAASLSLTRQSDRAARWGGVGNARAGSGVGALTTRWELDCRAGAPHCRACR